ncbi:helitron helicase-like domain-containing protein [Artemisia annua]|uniref:Helitron helicase-like domain-containing protein n=1 Tax=Artemisia annua TaxID=35608 RepID=A0A2U1QP93_ARTAN|nr:helitron helicase-like domain-containing protein [Artemisia annua]
MKEKHLPLSKNVNNSPTLKLLEKNGPIMHESLGSQLDYVTGVEGQNPSITKREMDFYYAGRGGVVSPPPSDFFSPRRRRPAKSVVGLPDHSSQECVAMPCNQTVCRVTEGSAVRDGQCSSGSMAFATGTMFVGDKTQIGLLPAVCREVVSEKRKRWPDEMLSNHQRLIISPDGARIVAQTSDSHAAVVEPPKRTRRGQPSINNDACHSLTIPQPLGTNACSVTQPSGSQAAENVVEPPKRGRRRKQPSTAHVADHSPTNAEPLPSHACPVVEPSDSHIVTDVVQPRKRSRRVSQAPAQSAGDNGETSASCTPPRMANPHATQSNRIVGATQLQKRNANQRRPSACRPHDRSQSIIEGSTSHALENASPPYENISEPSTSRTPPETANLHATPSMTYSQKRNTRPRRASARRPNEHSQNITEGSTSHALEDASPAYEDLGDCTERCRYCNAAFWRGERLAGRSYSAHVSHYHLCCGNGKVFMEPEQDPPETARDKCAQADVPEFKIRLYSGDRPRGYKLPSSNTIGAIVFDIGPETSARWPNERSQNITEGSTSHALEDASSAYEDLGDCTERCRYCNAAFWRGERLAGRSYSAHVSHYHLCCGNDPDSPPLDPEVVQGLIHFLDTHNELVQMFRTARDKCAQADVPEFKIRLYSGDRPRGYELPSSNTLGAIVFDRGPESESNYDVILEYRDGPLKRISKIHKSYMSLQFPLIFIYGQPGYHTKLMLRTTNPEDEPRRAIVCPKNETADIINSTVLDMVAGEARTYASYDIAIPVGNSGAETEMLYLPDAMEENTKALVQLPCKEIEQGKELEQMLIQNQETSESLPTPVAAASQDSGEQKKAEETSTTTLSLPANEIDQGKKVLDIVAGEARTYASYDIAIPVGNSGAETEMLHPPDAMEENTKALVQLPFGSSQAPIALTNEERVEQKKDGQASQASVTLPGKEIEQGKELEQMLIQNQETSESLPTPVAAASQDSGEQKKAEETSTATLSLPAKEIDQGKKIEQHELETPDKMVIDTQESSGTPPETMALIRQKPLKTTADQNTAQDSSAKTVRRALFENQPSQSKKQKGTYHMFIHHRCSFIE